MSDLEFPRPTGEMTSRDAARWFHLCWETWVIVANSVSLCVTVTLFRRSKEGRTARLTVLTNTVCDLSSGIVTLAFQLAARADFNNLSDVMCTLNASALIFIAYQSVLMVLTLGLVRYRILVQKPIGIKIVKMMIGTIWAFCFVYALFVGVMDLAGPTESRLYCFHHRGRYNAVYTFVTTIAAAFAAAPALVLLICYARAFQTVRFLEMKLDHSNYSRRVAYMGFTVVLVYFFSILPWSCQVLYQLIVEPGTEISPDIDAVTSILIHVSFGVNPVIYFAFQKEYVAVVREWLPWGGSVASTTASFTPSSRKNTMDDTFTKPFPLSTFTFKGAGTEGTAVFSNSSAEGTADLRSCNSSAETLKGEVRISFGSTKEDSVSRSCSKSMSHSVVKKEKSRSVVSDDEPSRSVINEDEPSHSAFKDDEVSRSAVEEEVSRPTVKEHEVSHSAADEVETSRSAVEEREISRSAVEKDEVSHSAVEEEDASGSVVEEEDVSGSAVEEDDVSRSAVEKIELSRSGDSSTSHSGQGAASPFAEEEEEEEEEVDPVFEVAEVIHLVDEEFSRSVSIREAPSRSSDEDEVHVFIDEGAKHSADEDEVSRSVKEEHAGHTVGEVEAASVSLDEEEASRSAKKEASRSVKEEGS